MLDSPKAPRTAAPTNFWCPPHAKELSVNHVAGKDRSKDPAAKVRKGTCRESKQLEICWNPYQIHCFMLKWAVPFSRTSGFQIQPNLIKSHQINIWTESNKLSDAEMEHFGAVPCPIWTLAHLAANNHLRDVLHEIYQALNPACPNVGKILRQYCMERQHRGNIAFSLYLVAEIQKSGRVYSRSLKSKHFCQSALSSQHGKHFALPARCESRFQTQHAEASSVSAMQFSELTYCFFGGEKNQRTQDGNEGRR